jgi:prepilin-type processing-associated H-X9-DG protein
LWPYLGQENQSALLSGELNEFLCPSNRWTANLSDREDVYGNRVDYAMNCNLRGEAAVVKIGNDTIAAVFYDQPVYPVSADDHAHARGTNFLFADGHAEWLPRNRIAAPWPDVDQYAGTDYEDWGLL